MTGAQTEIKIEVRFYSFFKDLAGCSQHTEATPNGTTLGELVQRLVRKFPRLEPMQKSVLMAVGLEYQDRNYVLCAGDEVSLFPPVQGG